MKKKLIITTMATLICAAAAFAQPTGEQVVTESAQAAATNQAKYSGSLAFFNDLESQAEITDDTEGSVLKYLQDKKLTKGLNTENGIYIATGFATIKANESSKKYEDARNVAFLEAMAIAKREIANFYGQEIETQLKIRLLQPKSAAARMQDAQAALIEPGILDKYEALINAKLDKELKKEGITFESPKAEVIVDNILREKSVNDSIKRTAAHSVGGIITLKIFEQAGEVSVIAYYSPNSILLAGAINGQTVLLPVLKKREGPSVKEFIQNLSIPDLYASQGVQQTTDKDGNIVLISYAISPALSKSGDSKQSAKQIADTLAAANIRRFAGEQVVTGDAINRNIASIELNDDSGDVYASAEREYQANVDLIAKKLNIPGIENIRTWNFLDPRSNTIVCGAVSIWSIKTAQGAIEQRDIAKPLTTPNGGFTGVKPVVEIEKSKKPGGESEGNTAIIESRESDLF